MIIRVAESPKTFPNRTGLSWPHRWKLPPTQNLGCCHPRYSSPAVTPDISPASSPDPAALLGSPSAHISAQLPPQIQQPISICQKLMNLPSAHNLPTYDPDLLLSAQIICPDMTQICPASAQIDVPAARMSPQI